MVAHGTWEEATRDPLPHVWGWTPADHTTPLPARAGPALPALLPTACRVPPRTLITHTHTLTVVTSSNGGQEDSDA